MHDAPSHHLPVRIWVIDDDTQLCAEFIAFWRKQTLQGATKYRLYPTAQEALRALKRQRQNLRPQALLVDGHLAGDTSNLSCDANVVKRILDARLLPPSALIGFSADPYANEDMLAAGAAKAFQKHEYHEALRYIHYMLFSGSAS